MSEADVVHAFEEVDGVDVVEVIEVEIEVSEEEVVLGVYDEWGDDVGYGIAEPGTWVLVGCRRRCP